MTRHRLFWPVLTLVVLLAVNAIFTSSFLNIRVQDGHLYGSLIDILRFGAPLLLVALGMTLVIATGGIDLSVGAVVAISGALSCLMVSKMADPGSVPGVVFAITVALALSAALGLFNGLLVAVLGLQPIVATLILMVAGRGVSQLITQGQIITVNSDAYKLVGGGYFAALPFSLFLVTAAFVVAGLLSRRTALGMLLESVGSNAEASRLAGTRATGIIVLAYVASALCAGLAGIIIASNVSSADGNNAGLFIELDAILAVVIGGTALTGGRYFLAGTVIGALTIQTLTTSVYSLGVSPQSALLFKAIVVTIVCLIQAPKFRAKLAMRRRRSRTSSSPNESALEQTAGVVA